MGLLVGLDALMVALVLFGAAYAVSTVFRPLLVGVLGQAPVIGGWLASNVDNGLASFQRSLSVPINNSVYLITSSLDWVANNGRDFLGSLTGLAGALWGTTWTLAAVTIPQAISDSESRVSGWVDDAKAWAVVQLQGLEARLGADIAQATAVAAADIAAARAEAAAGVAMVEADAGQLVAEAERKAGALFAQAEYDAQQFGGRAEQVAHDLVTQARTDLGAAVGAVEHDLQALAAAERVALQDSVSVLGGDIAAAETRANAALSEAEKGIRAEIESVLKSGPWAAVVEAYEGGEAALVANVEALVRASLSEIRKEIGDAEAVRAKYGPQLRGIISGLGKG